MKSHSLLIVLFVSVSLQSCSRECEINQNTTWEALHESSVGHVEKSEYFAALKCAERSLEFATKKFSAQDKRVSESLKDVAELNYSLFMETRAREFWLKQIELDEKLYGVDHPRLAVPLNQFALFYFKEGKTVQAEKTFQRILAILEKDENKDECQLANVHDSLAAVYKKMNKQIVSAQHTDTAKQLRTKIGHCDE